MCVPATTEGYRTMTATPPTPSLPPEPIDRLDAMARELLHAMCDRYASQWTPAVGVDDCLLKPWIHPFTFQADDSVTMLGFLPEAFVDKMFSSPVGKRAGTLTLDAIISQGVIHGYFLFSETWVASMTKEEATRAYEVRTQPNRESAIMLTCTTRSINRVYTQRVSRGKGAEVIAMGTGFEGTEIMARGNLSPAQRPPPS